MPQNYLPLGWGPCDLQFLVSLPYRCYILNLVKIGPVVLKTMLTDDGRRRTQPIAIGHLSDSGDLKIKMLNQHWLYIHVYCLLDTLSPSCKIPILRPVTSEQYTPFYFSRCIEISLFNGRWRSVGRH